MTSRERFLTAINRGIPDRVSMFDFLGVINNGMTLFGVGDFEKYIVRGLLILFAVLLNTVQLQSLQKVKVTK
jgi:ABC-type glucose/galactose transport system permease subunit